MPSNPVSNRIDRSEGSKSFRCADAGYADCDFQATGRNDDELMAKVEQHGRERHNLHLSPEQRESIRGRFKAA